jgi:hypothetical protein
VNKSFFKDEDAFVKFAQLQKEERARILKGDSKKRGKKHENID